MSSSIGKYYAAFVKSQKMLNQLRIYNFPFKIKAVVESCGILVSNEDEYKQYREATGDIRPYIKIKDARAYFDPNRGVYLIIYNENQHKNRIRFSIAHEFGHIIMGHLNDERTEIDRGGLSDFLYYHMEGEANTFAGNFLVPPIIVKERLGGREISVDFIRRSFEVSKTSVEDYRISDYQTWLESKSQPVEYDLLERYRRHHAQKHCNICGYAFYIKGAKYCPICGGREFWNGEMEDYMIYEKVRTDENGYVNECLRCRNEEHTSGGDYCAICGAPMVNRCLNALGSQGSCEHTEPLPGNARYCPFCGSKTAFFESCLLEAWNANEDMPF